MATGWNSQQGGGKYAIQFETDDRDLYKLVEKACQLAMDQEELSELRKQNCEVSMIDHLNIKLDAGEECEPPCGTCEDQGWDLPHCKGECKKRGYWWYKEVKHEQS